MFGKDNKNKDKQPSAEELLMQNLQAIQQSVDTLQKTVANQDTRTGAMIAAALKQAGVGQQQQQAPPQPEEDTAPKYTKEQIDEMSNSEFLQVIQQTMIETVKPVAGEIQQTRTAQARAKLESDFRSLIQLHPELAAYVPEIKQAMDDNPTLTASQAFAIAKDSVTPERQEEIDAQVKEMKTRQQGEAEREATETSDGRSAEPRQNNDGEEINVIQGFFPNQPSRAEGSDDMSPEDAGEDAWQSIFGNATVIGG